MKIDKRCFILLTAAMLTATGITANTVRVADSTDNSPLPAASVFDLHGNMIGITDNNGDFNSPDPAIYPLMIRYLGYEPSQVLPGDTTVSMTTSSVMLPDVVVKSDATGVRLICNLKLTISICADNDTISISQENMVDYLLPLHRLKGKGKFKEMKNPRVLNTRGKAITSNQRNRREDENDYDDLIDIMLVYASIGDMEYDLTTDFNSGKGGEDITIRRAGDRVGIKRDILYGEKNHVWSPMALKLLGMTTDFHKMEFNMVFDIGYDSIHLDPQNLLQYSYTMSANMRGKWMKMLLNRDNAAMCHIYIDITPVAVEMLTSEESKSLAKAKDLTYPFPR